MRLRFVVFALLMCLMRFTLQNAFAQDPVAAVEGEVLDPSAAAIVGATVTVTNLDTGYTKNQVTSANGSYRLSLVPIGRYAVSIEAALTIPPTTGPAQCESNRAAGCATGAGFAA